MRNLLIIAMLLTGAFMAGWFQVQRDGDRTTIEINRQEIRQDTREALDRGREFLRQQEMQGDFSAGAPDASFPLVNQQPSTATQAGYWSNDPNQFPNQGTGVYPNPQTPPPTDSTWPHVAPAGNWQYQWAPDAQRR